MDRNDGPGNPTAPLAEGATATGTSHSLFIDSSDFDEFVAQYGTEEPRWFGQARMQYPQNQLAEALEKRSERTRKPPSKTEADPITLPDGTSRNVPTGRFLARMRRMGLKTEPNERLKKAIKLFGPEPALNEEKRWTLPKRGEFHSYTDDEYAEALEKRALTTTKPPPRGAIDPITLGNGETFGVPTGGHLTTLRSKGVTTEPSDRLKKAIGLFGPQPTRNQQGKWTLPKQIEKRSYTQDEYALALENRARTTRSTPRQRETDPITVDNGATLEIPTGKYLSNLRSSGMAIEPTDRLKKAIGLFGPQPTRNEQGKWTLTRLRSSLPQDITPHVCELAAHPVMSTNPGPTGVAAAMSGENDARNSHINSREFEAFLAEHGTTTEPDWFAGAPLGSAQQGQGHLPAERVNSADIDGIWSDEFLEPYGAAVPNPLTGENRRRRITGTNDQYAEALEQRKSTKPPGKTETDTITLADGATVDITTGAYLTSLRSKGIATEPSARLKRAMARYDLRPEADEQGRWRLPKLQRPSDSDDRYAAALEQRKSTKPPGKTETDTITLADGTTVDITTGAYLTSLRSKGIVTEPSARLRRAIGRFGPEPTRDEQGRWRLPPLRARESTIPDVSTIAAMTSDHPSGLTAAGSSANPHAPTTGGWTSSVTAPSAKRQRHGRP
ncbi:hypothetical protein ABT336_08930 [Micromonospora sp. NPDC000207]|uniref:hypothetical protein n=1 Tax=Micromonospora sp. NPDC000207 TaxID=3154246 RepID=UPI00332A70B8